MDEITTSTPGKLMLFGEHAVLYQQPCIVTAVDLRMQVSICTTETPQLQVVTPLNTSPFVISNHTLLNETAFPKEVSFICVAIKNFLISSGLDVGLSLK